VAEAAKVIENTLRDLNIALVNELAIIFRQMGIDTLDVLEAAVIKSRTGCAQSVQQLGFKLKQCF
jgi:UDP-N-acetyl-D-mannosaminuronate dehydrogenase